MLVERIQDMTFIFRDGEDPDVISSDVLEYDVSFIG